MKPPTRLTPNRLYKLFVFILLVAHLIGTHLVTTVDAADRFSVANRGKTTPLVSVTIDNLPVQQAADLLEKKTNYRIELQSINPSERVSGQFIETDIETVCTNLLRRYNISILVDTGQRTLTVKSLGPKVDHRHSDHPVNDGTLTSSLNQDHQKDSVVDAPNLANSPETDQRDPFTGLTHDEIVTLHQHQIDELKSDKQQPEDVDPFTGMKNSDMVILHKNQAAEIERDRQQLDSTTPANEMKKEEMNSLQEE